MVWLLSAFGPRDAKIEKPRQSAAHQKEKAATIAAPQKKKPRPAAAFKLTKVGF